MSTRDCCTPTTGETTRPAGLSMLPGRIGTWATWRAALYDRLTTIEVDPGVRPLATLGTRDDADATLALLDACAVAADVVTFYQERILNEGYLGTATESFSLTELARMVGHEPRPGVSAAAWLAFTVSPATITPVTVPAGTSVMSIPGANERAQTFESSEPLEARLEWNTLAVATRLPIPELTRTSTVLYLEGVNTGLKVGAPLLLVGSARDGDPTNERWEFRRVASLMANSTEGHTVVVLDRATGDPYTQPPANPVSVFALRDRASFFGATAPDWNFMATEVRTNLGGGTQWPDFAIGDEPGMEGAAAPSIDLDKEYPRLMAGGWIVIEDRYDVEAYRIERITPMARTGFTLAAKVTRLKLDGDENLAGFSRRGSVLHVESDALTRLGEPATADVSGTTIDLAVTVAGMEGRAVIVSGTRSDTREAGSEARTIVSIGVAADGVSSQLILDASVGPYLVDSVVLYGNVVEASHGTTVASEIIGSGDPRVPWQTVRVPQQPVTYVPAPTDTGGQSTLTVSVDGTAWTEVETLYGSAANDRVYTTRRDVDGRLLVSFGDGVVGARPPRGAGNVVATYRKGLGLEGQVRAGTLTLLTSRPVGIQGVTNPAAAAGAADADTTDTIRGDVGRRIRTLDRLVTVADYEGYAAAFSGVGKARAVALWAGQRRWVHVTIAGSLGETVDAGAPPRSTLLMAIRERCDPTHTVLVDTYSDVRFGIRARLVVIGNSATVVAAARAALADAFSFASRQFGQPVFDTEVISVLQGVDGVVGVDLDGMSRVGGADAATLLAQPARCSGSTVLLAELLRISDNVADVLLSLESA